MEPPHTASAPAHPLPTVWVQPEPSSLRPLLTWSLLPLKSPFRLPAPKSPACPLPPTPVLRLRAGGVGVIHGAVNHMLSHSVLPFPAWQWGLNLVLFNLSPICHHLLCGQRTTSYIHASVAAASGPLCVLSLSTWQMTSRSPNLTSGFATSGDRPWLGRGPVCVLWDQSGLVTVPACTCHSGPPSRPPCLPIPAQPRTHSRSLIPHKKQRLRGAHG